MRSGVPLSGCVGMRRDSAMTSDPKTSDAKTGDPKTGVMICGHGSRSQAAVDEFAVLAEKPWMIEDCLLEKELDDSVAIMARICDGGRYRWLLLDDRMPCGRK